MRWYKNPEPERGEVQIIEKFLLFPKCINNQCRWLERAKIKRMYIYDHDYQGLFWENIAWAHEEE